MKARKCFYLDLDYQLTVYNKLNEFALGYIKLENGIYRWFFPMSSLSKIKEVLPVELEQEKKIIVDLEKSKGKSGIEVIEFPKLYQCKEWRKNDKGEVKRITHEVTKEQVGLMWEVLKKIPQYRKVKTRTIASNWVEILGIDRFHRKTGTFDFEKMFGCREEYFKMYYTLKVLQWLGSIKYYKNGYVERLENELPIQTVIK